MGNGCLYSTRMPATPARRNRRNDMNVYRIEYNGKAHFVSASSAKRAMLKHFGMPSVIGATIKKVGEGA